MDASSASDPGASREPAAPAPAWSRFVPAVRLVATFAAAVVGLLLLVRAFPVIHDRLSMFAWDLGVDHATARGWLDGVNAFSNEGAETLGLVKQFGVTANGHPPTTSFWVLPMARMSLTHANVVAGGLTVVLLLLGVLAVGQTLRWPALLVTGWLVFAYFASTSLFAYHVQIGQFSCAIGFMYIVAWRGLRRGDDVLAGIALGLAVSMKPFAGAVVMLLVVAQRPRALLAAGGAFLFVVAVMTARFGVEGWRFFVQHQRAVAAVWGPHIQNQTVLGILSRLGFPACGPPWPEGAPGFWAAAGATLATVALVGLAARLTWGSPRTPDDWDVPFALFVVLSVLTSKFAWEHYALMYIMPVAVLVDRLVRDWRAGQRRVSAAAMLVVLAAIVASWRIDYYEKQRLQVLVRSGDASAHVPMHLYEVMAWLPGVLLAAFLFVLAWRAYRMRTSAIVAARNTTET